MRLAPPIVLASLVALSGCSLFHSNIKGGFACSAPKGTCAPSMRIDDAAIHEIGGQDEHGSDKSAADSESRAERPQKATDAGLGRTARNREWVFVRGARPELRIVYPEWHDAAGQLHPRTTAYTPVDVAPAVPRAITPLDRRSLGGTDTGSLLAIAEMAPEIAAMPAPPQTADRPAKSDDKLAPAPDTHAGTQAARPGALDAIKDQVKEILSNAGRAGGSATPAMPAKPDAKPVASFPPAGN
ncbi:hypothetical protein AQZ52_14155 [Novosphingobium fuchskuhlense]|uniref:Conjugal transfer protein TraV n=1 Tax=Novosphingobium fuchskuhlense TaxID=1117702 RepID=A0A124JTC0_9SPHN|nr:hypothetical protein [Novosphingobium fuchskuhlense]KUR70022.1 hypothetical protein AQZ52_14155 [Novosphingobium fuchskuhlense]